MRPLAAWELPCPEAAGTACRRAADSRTGGRCHTWEERGQAVRVIGGGSLLGPTAQSHPLLFSGQEMPVR